MKKNQIVLIILLVLICGFIIFWAISQKMSTSYEEAVITPTITPQTTPETNKEIYSFPAVVSGVNIVGNFLTVKPEKEEKEEKEIKIILSEETELTKLGLPSKLPKEGVFIPTKTKIKISDIKVGDKIFVKAKSNITGKTEFDDIEYIQVFP